MFSPEMMKLAQEQMARMTPQQMEQMRQMQANMSPEAMRVAMQQMQNMRPQDIQRAQQQMANMSPDDVMKATADINEAKLKQAAANFEQHQKGVKAYELTASNDLKVKGNALVQQRKYQEAAVEYQRAVDNLEGHNDPGATELRMNCKLNMALCYLKEGEHDKVLTLCTDVMRTNGENVKALYRRGLAYKELHELEKAFVDLKRAHDQWPNDEAVKTALVETELALERAGVDEDKKKEAEAHLENERNEAQKLRDRADALLKAKEAGSVDQYLQSEQLKEAAEQMRKNPDLMKTASAQLANMDESQLEMLNKMAAARGMPAVTPEMAKMAAERTKNMSPEELENVLKMSQGFAAGGSGGRTLTAGADSDFPPASPAMGGVGALPQGGDMAAQMEMAQKAMLQNPEMMKMAADMMKAMSPEQIKQMGKLQGREMSDAEAEKAAAMMQNMDPKNVERLFKVAGGVQKAYGCCQKAKAVALGRTGKQVLLSVGVGIAAFVAHGYGLF